MRLFDFFRGKQKPQGPQEPERPGQKFEIGQDVTQIVNTPWINQEGETDNIPHPKFGKIYKVTCYVWMTGARYTGWGIGLAGMPTQYAEPAFAPVISTDELMTALTEEPAHQTV